MAAKLRVNKKAFLGALSCSTLAWFLRNSPQGTLSEGDRLRIDEGKEIGDLARKLWPEGVLVDDKDVEAAARTTARLIAAPAITVIFEATFLSGDYVTRADVLVRSKRGWKLIEVKSRKNLADELIEDVAYTFNVATNAGVQISGASLLLLSPAFRAGKEPHALFEEHDVTDEVNELLPTFEKIWADVPKWIRKKQEPKLVFDCRHCEFFESDCLGRDVEHHVFTLPRISAAKFAQLQSVECTSIHSIPAHFPLTPKQSIVRQAVTSGQAVVDHAGLRDTLNAIQWPAYYLDFESTKTAIPVFPEFGPHEALVTQYSLHARQSPRHKCDHRAYLSSHERDCRRELFESLLRDLGTEGSIVVYSNYEKKTLQDWANVYPAMRARINKCITRIVDLHRTISDYLYHPEFSGSTSIKTTLPVLTEINYDDLQVQDGDTATALFARMIRGEVSPNEVPAVRQSLLDYCQRDTQAMVDLHDALLKLIR